MPIHCKIGIGTIKSTCFSTVEGCRGVMADNLAKARLLAIRREGGGDGDGEGGARVMAENLAKARLIAIKRGRRTRTQGCARGHRGSSAISVVTLSTGGVR